MLAAMESAAFGETDLATLLDIGLSVISADTIIFKMIQELRELRKTEPDWRKAFEWLRTHYGYDTYGGNCHMIRIMASLSSAYYGVRMIFKKRR